MSKAVSAEERCSKHMATIVTQIVTSVDICTHAPGLSSLSRLLSHAALSCRHLWFYEFIIHLVSCRKHDGDVHMLPKTDSCEEHGTVCICLVHVASCSQAELHFNSNNFH